jgi:hypothetical protein
MTVQKIIFSYIISLSRGCHTERCHTERSRSVIHSSTTLRMTRFLLFELSSTVEYLYFQAFNFIELQYGVNQV